MGKLVLISNYFETTKKNKLGNYMNPIGILSIATVAEQGGHACYVFDFNSKGITIKDVFNCIEENQPDLVAISAYTENIDYIFKFIRHIRKFSPKSRIVIGGPHATLEPDYCLKSKYVDFISINEGESTILELMEAIVSNEETIQYKDIPLLIENKHKEKSEHSNKYRIEDLDLLPFIKRSFIPKQISDIDNIITSRGCPAKCIYCSAAALSGSKYRVRNVDNVYLEFLNIIIDTGRCVFIADDTFTAIRKRTLDFSRYIKLFKIDNAYWKCESRVDVVNEELIKIMKDSGCVGIQYGIESGSQEVLNSIRKNINLDRALEVIDMTNKEGISVVTSFMIGHFCDTKETLNKTKELIKYLKEKYLDDIVIFLAFNTPFPGTWQYLNLKEIGMSMNFNAYKEMTLLNPLIQTENFTSNDLVKIYGECLSYIVTGSE